MKITLKCDRKIAYDSPDHLEPLGTLQDNSRNERFNIKFYNLIDKNKNKNSILDLGCAGGGFVRSCINDGCIAIGIEGSDYSQKMKREEWAVIPEFLLTCDIAERFELSSDKIKMKFNLITAWEVLEHIKEDKIINLIGNIKKHLTKEGLFIASISNSSSKSNGVELHQTQRTKEWWIKKFEENGFYERKELYSYFNKQYVRGRKETLKEFHTIFSLNNKEYSFKLSLRSKLVDFWAGSRLQRFLKYLIIG